MKFFMFVVIAALIALVQPAPGAIQSGWRSDDILSVAKHCPGKGSVIATALDSITDIAACMKKGLSIQDAPKNISQVENEKFYDDLIDNCIAKFAETSSDAVFLRCALPKLDIEENVDINKIRKLIHL